MRSALVALKSSSSNRWLARQARDPFVRGRAAGDLPSGSHLRARSGFKLGELASKYKGLFRGRAVVDLGAAPGGWSQVALAAVQKQSGRGGGREGAVVAVDLLPMDELPGVEVVTGDFFDPQVQEQVRNGLRGAKGNEDGSADTVLSDMMAAMSGVRVRDIQASLDLVSAATEFAHAVLRPANAETGYQGGSLVVKWFNHPELLAFRKAELDPYFERVATEKPKASRSESSEAYWVCLGYKGRDQSAAVAPVVEAVESTADENPR